MISKIMEQKLNDQIQREFESAYIYKAMSQFFAQKNLSGFKHFYDEQASEEIEHSEKLISYVNQQGGCVKLEAIPAPKSNYGSILEVFEDALEHEKMVTKNINELVKLAKEECDYATDNFLQWYVSEQVEEEDNFTSLVDIIKFLNNDPVSIFLLDSKLGRRNSD